MKPLSLSILAMILPFNLLVQSCSFEFSRNNNKDNANQRPENNQSSGLDLGNARAYGSLSLTRFESPLANNKIDFNALGPGKKRTARFDFRVSSPSTIALASQNFQFSCSSQAPLLRFGVVKAADASVVVSPMRFEDFLIAPLEKRSLEVNDYAFVVEAEFFGECKTAIAEFGITLTNSVPQQTDANNSNSGNGNNGPRPAPTATPQPSPEELDRLRRLNGILAPDARFVRLVYMSKKEGCVEEFNQSLAELKLKDDLLKESESPIKLSTESRGQSIRYEIETTVSGVQYSLFWLRSLPTDDFKNLGQRMLDSNARIVLSDDPQCLGNQEATYVNDFTRFVLNEPGSRISESRALSPLPQIENPNRAKLLFSYDFSGSESFFFKTQVSFAITDEKLERLPDFLDYSFFDTDKDARVTEWIKVPKSELRSLDFTVTNFLELHRILPRLGHLKMIFRVQNSDQAGTSNYSDAFFFDIGRVCLGSLSSEYFKSANGNSLNCKEITEEMLPQQIN